MRARKIANRGYRAHQTHACKGREKSKILICSLLRGFKVDTLRRGAIKKNLSSLSFLIFLYDFVNF